MVKLYLVGIDSPNITYTSSGDKAFLWDDHAEVVGLCRMLNGSNLGPTDDEGTIKTKFRNFRIEEAAQGKLMIVFDSGLVTEFSRTLN